MAAHSPLYLYLWIAPHALQVALAVMMVRRKLAREFPAFFLYITYEVLQFVVLFALYKIDAVTAEQYSAVWVVGGAVSVAFRFAIVYEIFEHVFRSYPTLKEFGTLLFRWATVVLMIVAVVLVGYSTGAEVNRFTLAVSILGRAVSVVQCGLLVLLLLLSRLLSFSWRSYAFGIALGLGFFASVELALSAIQTELGLGTAPDFFNLLGMATYHCCVLFWIVALLSPKREAVPMTSVPAHNLEHWNHALRRVLHP
jgi:hypothetical protein